MSSPSFSFGASPSVSKERWFKHAVQKMSKGYNLFVNEERKVANFYKGYGEFESCSYKTARKLILQGHVVPVGEQELGMEYKLKSDTSLDVPVVVDEDDIDDEDTEDVVIETDEAMEDADDMIDDEDDEEAPGYDDDAPVYDDEDEE